MPEIRKTYQYEQGEEGALMDFIVRVTNGALPGAWVSFNANPPSPSGPITLPKTPVTSNSFAAGVQQECPANFKTTFEVIYFSSEAPPATFNLQLVAFFSPTATTLTESR